MKKLLLGVLITFFTFFLSLAIFSRVTEFKIEKVLAQVIQGVDINDSTIIRVAFSTESSRYSYTCTTGGGGTPTTPPTSPTTPPTTGGPTIPVIPSGEPHPPGTDTSVSAKLGPLEVGGNADDPAIWIHPTDSTKSLMFLSDKDAGVYVYDYAGNQLQHINFGTNLNNIEVRTGFQYGSETVDVVVGNLRDSGTLFVGKILPNWSQGSAVEVLSDNNSSGNGISGNSYGFTIYKSSTSGKLYVFEKPKNSDDIVQWEIDGSSGSINTIEKRRFSGYGVAEGMVADDQFGFVYFVEESGPIHKHYAEPDASTAEISSFGSGNGETADLEGITMYRCNDGRGYLVLSSQGNSTYKVYNRLNDNEFIKTFTTDKTSGTDGLAVSSSAVPGFPNGFAVIHHDSGAQYYLFDWSDISKGELAICVNGN